jgi:hypothetical protein
MEDAHAAVLKLDDTDASFFGVYDGHGGKNYIPLWTDNERLLNIIF